MLVILFTATPPHLSVWSVCHYLVCLSVAWIQKQQRQQRQQQSSRRAASRQQPLPWTTRNRAMMTASPLRSTAITTSTGRQKRLSSAPSASARVEARSKTAAVPRQRAKDVTAAKAKEAAKAAAAMLASSSSSSTSNPGKG